MLFQPTNITPDILGGEGNGVVDVSTGTIKVSWQVNGNSPMTSAKIEFYNSNGTLIFSSTDTLSEPFYGTDQYGNVQMYTTSIDAQNYLANGNTYQMAITMYWNDNGTQESVKQRSYSVFYTRATPVITITADTVISSCDYEFTATCTRGNDEATLNWIRWQIYDADDSNNPIYDTGRVYGAQFACYYDGFMNNHSYIVIASAQTVEGQIVSATHSFSTAWEISSLAGKSTAIMLNNQSSAVKVYWDGFRYISGEPTGDYTVADGVLSLPKTSNVLWDEVNGEPMSLDVPWYMVYRTILRNDDMMLLLTQNGQRDVSLVYSYSSRTLNMLFGTTVVASFPKINGDDVLTIIVTPTLMYVRRYGYVDGLTPSTTLTPTTTLPPRDGHYGVTLEAVQSISYTQSNVTSVQVFGFQTCDYIQLVNDTIKSDVIQQAYTDGTYIPTQADGSTPINPNTQFLADFVNGLDAGTLTIGGANITGWAIYRKQASEPITRHLANVSLETSAILDFGCGTGQGSYTYYIYPISDNMTYITAAFESNPVNPVSWNWSIVEASQNEEGICSVLNEYVFRGNVSSGDMSNNNSPSVMQNFTRYPTVQMSNANYMSGTLTGLIGQVGYVSYMIQAGDTLESVAHRFGITTSTLLLNNEIQNGQLAVGTVIRIFLPDGMYSYYDDIQMRDTIYALSTTTNRLFLKNRKGDVIEIRTSSPISASIQDNTAEQATTMSIPWVQIGDASTLPIIGKAKN